MSKLHDLNELGQSIWLDYIRRDLIDSGKLSQLCTTGVRGVTSNPSIFQKAIADSDDYDDDLRLLAAAGHSPKEIYEHLAIDDIQRAADEFHPIFVQSEGVDGYVSLEANPRLAYDTEATIREARRLFAAVDRPNVYIKVPATPEGIPAIEQLISEGININVTLLFALSAYEAVTEAYISGVEKFVENGGDPGHVNSVASFFVSRVDTKVDNRLDEIGHSDIRGKIGIANAKMAYQRFLQIFGSDRWQQLGEKGAHAQRVLYGSTSTKDPAYPDTYYMDNLIGPETVNTVPPETLEAFLDHGTVKQTLTEGVDEAQAALEALDSLGISLDGITDELLEEGVRKFADSFDKLLDSIARARAETLHEEQAWEINLGDARESVDKAVQALETNNILERMWDQDHTVWSDDPTEITNRLGWLTIADEMFANTAELEALGADARAEGLADVVVLGMGGSSLAPELFARVFGPSPGYPDLHVLDSTDPVAVSNLRNGLDAKKTWFVVSSKSGSTVETLSFFKYFYSWIADNVGAERAGSHFIAVTDPGSRLAAAGEQYNFRAVFLNNPEIGGRYSALSYFGLVPAALLGIDVEELLQRAKAISGPGDAHRAAFLGAVLGTMARAGRDKMALITSPRINAFGDWVEQLIAESTGKQGEGILPLVGAPPAAPEVYGDDQFIVYLMDAQDAQYAEQVRAIAADGHPVITINLHDLYDIAEQFLIWEIATAVAGHILGINPFDQPNVESAKVRAREMVDAYIQSGELPQQAPRLKQGNVEVHALQVPARFPSEALKAFLQEVAAGDYIAVHAYVPPTPANDVALAGFRTFLRDESGAPVTIGYGPRFLHSTGQLHKGDSGNGHFIQLTTEPLQDLPIPDEPGSHNSSLTFGVLKMAQALGDARALQEAGRRLIRFHLWSNDIAPLLAELQK